MDRLAGPLLLSITLMCSVGCSAPARTEDTRVASRPPSQVATPSPARARSEAALEIPRVLERQAEAWNRGDLDGFMQAYWRSPQLSFSSRGKVTRGWEPMGEYFRTSYPDKAAMGRLTFTDLEVTPLGDDAALVLGRWQVEGTKPTSGAFSLVLRRIGGQWMIIHDHTSRDAA